MNDREAMIAGIFAHPDDDCSRLVYAEWLDDYGNELDRAHARLIRVQCDGGSDIGVPVGLKLGSWWASGGVAGMLRTAVTRCEQDALTAPEIRPAAVLATFDGGFGEYRPNAEGFRVERGFFTAVTAKPCDWVKMADYIKPMMHPAAAVTLLIEGMSDEAEAIPYSVTWSEHGIPENAIGSRFHRMTATVRACDPLSPLRLRGDDWSAWRALRPLRFSADLQVDLDLGGDRDEIGFRLDHFRRVSREQMTPEKVFHAWWPWVSEFRARPRLVEVDGDPALIYRYLAERYMLDPNQIHSMSQIQINHYIGRLGR